MFKKLLILLTFISAAIRHAEPNHLTDDEINAKIAYWNRKLEENNLLEAFKEFKSLRAKRHHHKPKKVPKLCDFEESKDPPKEFDFIVVGGGSAGSVLANRLSEQKTFSVLLLERGGTASKITNVPGLNPYSSLTENADQNYLQPQSNVGLGLKHGRVLTFGGNVLGGSSTIDSTEASRGHKSDFSSWGNGWCADDLSAYFTKTEKANFTNNINSAYHRFDGLLSSTDSYLSGIGKAFIQCGVEKGYSEIDITGDFNQGFSRVQTHTQKGKRVDKSSAFLTAAKTRSNLVIQSNCFVIQILIHPETKKAYGLKYVNKGKIYTVKVKYEILLALGVFGSPTLLLHSGIGPRKELHKHGIHCIKDLPVGKQMHDQISYVGIGLFANDSCPATMHDLINKHTIKDFLQNGNGPLASANNFDAIAHININSPNPNVMFRCENRFWSIDKGLLLKDTIGIDDKFYRKYFKRCEGKKMFSIVPVLKAKSKGFLKIKSKNPFDKPLLFGNYYSNPHDARDMVDAIKFILNFIKCESFKKFGVELYDAPIPGCEHKKKDAYWYCAIKYLTVSNQAFTGTCKMGPDTDKTSVVNLNLEVHGIKGLRVCDSSIIPGTITGPDGGIATMIAEKAADLVKAKFGVVATKVCTQVKIKPSSEVH